MNQFHAVTQNGATNEPDAYDLAKCALDNYQAVINSYIQQENPEANLQEMAAWAYYGAGTIYQKQDQLQDASKMYEKSLSITTDQELIRRCKVSLEELKQ